MYIKKKKKNCVAVCVCVCVWGGGGKCVWWGSTSMKVLELRNCRLVKQHNL